MLEDSLVKSGVTARVLGYTTREPREGEINGVDVNFLSEWEGQERYYADDSVQRLFYNDNYYGKNVADFEQAFSKSNAVSCVVEPTGVAQIKTYAAKHNIAVVSYFISAPTKVMIERLMSRMRMDTNADPAYYAKRMQHLTEKEIFWGRDYAFTETLISKEHEDTQKLTQHIADHLQRLSCAYT